MTPDEFRAQCLDMLKAAREWDDSIWEELEDTWTMGILDAMCDLEGYIEDGEV